MTGVRNRLACLLFAVVFGFNLTVSVDQQFSYLAESFLQGKTYFLASPAFGYDTVFFQGKYYWPLGPFPAVLLPTLCAGVSFLRSLLLSKLSTCFSRFRRLLFVF